MSCSALVGGLGRSNPKLRTLNPKPPLANRIRKAQEDNLHGILSLFEKLTNERIDAVHEKAEAADRLKTKLTNCRNSWHGCYPEGRIPKGGEPDRRFTLVFGGWARDTRKQVILQQLGAALDQLGFRELLNPPFCTGPRRSTALAVFSARGGESEYATRRRMHSIIMGLAGNEVTIPVSGRKMLATYSKSKTARTISTGLSQNDE